MSMPRRPLPLRPRRRFFAVALAFALAAPSIAARAQDAPPAPAAPELAPAAAPAPTTSLADAAPADLDALGVQDESRSAGADEHPLQLYGFADMTYYLPLFSSDSYLAANVPSQQSFVMGNFNLYIAKQISSRLRSLGEVRFSYLPNGQATGNGYQSTQADDPAAFFRPTRWGGIVIERLHIEYDLLSNLTLRAGSFLTPYGIWNVDHGSPTIISIRAPYIIGEGLFPERQTGLELIGHHYFSEFALEYHLTLSNGRGPIDETRDLDSNKAVGGRLLLEWRHDADIKLGASYYRGTYTNATPTTFDVMTGHASANITERYLEQDVAADLSVDFRHFVFRGEFLRSDHRYDDAYRGSGPTFTPDNTRWGTYGIFGYHLPAGFLPYAVLQYYRFPDTPGNQYNPKIKAIAGGADYRLHPNVVLKAEYTYAKLADSPLAIIANTPFKAFEFQISWVF